MAYVALYRAYRPQKFSEVVGQENIIKTLQNAIKLNKVAHAYLFCGPRGTGKTTLAKIMAKAMNCEHGPSIEPCCECEICKGITKGSVSDVIEIDAASNNGADDIRALRETVKFMPSVGKYKVYIIDEVHMLSTAAFNALLKTLEEPPHHVIFILATTEPYKLPTTILSRCQRFDFQGISIEDILKRLRIVAKEENINISDEALHQIAISAEGGMRDALSLFDQCISYSVNPEITVDDVLSVSGNVSYLKLIELLKYANESKTSDAINVLDELIKIGKEVPKIASDLITFLRDLLMYKSDAILEHKPMFENSEFKSLSDALYKSVIFAWLDIINSSINQMRFSTQKRAYLELAILKMSDNKKNEDAKLIERVEILEHLVENLQNNQKPARIVNNEFKPTFSSNEEIMKMRNNPPVTPNFESKPVEVEVKPEVKIEVQPQEKIENNVVTPATFENKVGSPKIDENSSDEITSKDIEIILNQASKDRKNMLNEVWKKLEINEKYQNLSIIQMLLRGKVIAVSEKAFIVELSGSGFCNKLMKYENFVKIIEIFNEYNLKFEDYICIPKDVWSKIANDYKNKYNPQDPKPVELEFLKTDIKKRVMPKIIEKSPEEELIENTKEFIEDLVVEE